MATTQTLRHLVLFGFKAGTTPADVRRIEKEFARLPALIPLVRAYEWGVDISPEGLAQGNTHCFLLTFDRTEDRDAYLVHPDHQRFVALLRPHLEKATVLDYWVK